MVELFQQILDATEEAGQVTQVQWGTIRPLCVGNTDAERMRNFMRWLVGYGRVASVPDLAGPNGLSDAALISIGRQ